MTWHRVVLWRGRGVWVGALLGLAYAVSQWLDWPAFDAQAGWLLFWAVGHCDTLDGPLVSLARQALEEKNVNRVLPWVRAQDEPQIRQAFAHTLAVRELGPQARTLADHHFFETLVRVHRAGEGAPFTGLKPAGLDLGPVIPAADRALQVGAADALLKLLLDAVRDGVQARFQAALRLRAFEPDDVAAGRQYVAAYVDYMHCVDKLWGAVSKAPAPVNGPPATAPRYRPDPPPHRQSGRP